MQGDTPENQQNGTTEIGSVTPESEKVLRPIIRETHKDPKEHQADNVEFLKNLGAVTPESQKEALKKAAEWNRQGDLDLLRSAGLSYEQIKADPQERHVRLAAMFLKREANQNGLVFAVNFPEDQNYTRSLDLADILPGNILAVDILDPAGRQIVSGAARGVLDGRPGYIDPQNKSRVELHHGLRIRVKETQSSRALQDRMMGEQTYLQGQMESGYLTRNAQKGAIKEKVRQDARKQNQEVVTDKSFFDEFLEKVLNALNLNNPVDPKNPLDFSKIEQALTGFLSSLGLGSFLGNISGKPAESSPGKQPAPQVYKPESIRASGESKNAARIDRKWLMENVGKTNAEVQEHLKVHNFLGANLRVNKLIIPYLIEAEERTKKSGLDFRCKPYPYSSGQNWRGISDGDTLSYHCWGTAIDLNTAENPDQRKSKNQPMRYNLPGEFIAIMRDLGFRWGGDFHDPMHFEMQANPKNNIGVLRSEKARQAASMYLA